MIHKVSIPKSQVFKVLQTEEGHFTDLKAVEIAPAKLTKAIAAFANADGGELYVGIDEGADGKNHKWRGFTNIEAANGHLQVFEELFPLGGDFLYEFLSCDGEFGLILHVIIQKTKGIKHASDGKAYIRRGSQSLPVGPDGMERLRRNKGMSSFESETVAASIDLISNSLTIIDFMLSSVPTGEPEAWLRKQMVIVADKPTVAGLLLYSDEPQAVLPKRCAIKVYRYKTTDAEGSRENLAFDPLTIEGSLYEQIKQAVAKTAELIEGVKVLGPEGLTQITYPFETLHEIITNAVIHRDYGTADDVHVRIFDNRVEVESPGRLPAHVTTTNILKERFSRNGAIVRLINKFPDPPNKDVGEGLATAFAAMKKLKLKDPVIEERENSVRVNIRHERLGSPEEIIMQYLETHPEINNRTVRALTGIGSENKVKTIFLRLIDAVQIERVPGKRGSASAYRRVSMPSGDSAS
ncbi:ATP-dependent DNA helicase RecG [Streptomyces sp. 2224.1]|uniref:ATP-binding protein n=1 Tax=unclassified Streptomyces TaxID=2593676 RepID=UPI0008889E01|nr:MULTISPECIES: ATP-binding protein [unclassified Streptomyces]PBC84744.1 ATP-dependent DNA helicase RecG [Streptomyces sp. 2321.6]SDR27236.1 ATP-dependent DNA helicase RecG [Streptomyces sp. KS_16]SEB63411.1 ATP-dependent DNA helicase RecG [Streptomyces sp. 2224.1]SED42888.1 ATP-dependent DNA helicase RecG [Streptomyces sp. 2133.1]SNC70767.1 ATP-dependent DNA helicase RecG [Streptomyces sp. 2114.4]